MTREKTDFIYNYLTENCKDDSYEAAAEKEDIARACAASIDWAINTFLDKINETLYDFEGLSNTHEEKTRAIAFAESLKKKLK